MILCECVATAPRDSRCSRNTPVALGAPQHGIRLSAQPRPAASLAEGRVGNVWVSGSLKVTFASLPLWDPFLLPSLPPPCPRTV